MASLNQQLLRQLVYPAINIDSSRKERSMHNTPIPGPVGSANQSSGPRMLPGGIPIYPEELQKPDFEELPKCYLKPGGPRKASGSYLWLCGRSKEAEMTIGPELLRNEVDASHISLNDPLNHPRPEAYYNYEGRRHKELTKLEKRVLEMAVHYPNIQGGIMRAPLYFREGALSKPAATQPRAAEQVFGNRELFDLIVQHLIPRQEDLMNLSRTCQLTARMVESTWMRCDATEYDYKGWETDILDRERAREQHRATGHSRFFSPNVMVSPVRPHDQGPAREVAFTATGYPLNASVEEVKEPSYVYSMIRLFQFLNFVYRNGKHVKNLVIHGLSWFSADALSCILPHLPKLECLCIYQCCLMDLSDTAELLTTINTINKKRLEAKQPRVAVDFSPFYYKGPVYQADGTGRFGEYGATPEETRTGDSQRDFAAFLLSIWRLCQDGGQDFFTPGTGFRAFLDRLPIRTLPSLLVSLKAIHNFYTAPGRGCLSPEAYRAMEYTVWQRLILSWNGCSMPKEEVAGLIRRSDGVIPHAYCRECDASIPTCFFQQDTWGDRNQYCGGCRWCKDLRHHQWRLHYERRYLSWETYHERSGEKRTLRKVLKTRRRTGVPGLDPCFVPLLPIMANPFVAQRAAEIWDIMTVRLLEDIKNAYQTIEMGADPNEQTEKIERREFQMGTSQRLYSREIVRQSAPSWEVNIKKFRTELAIKHGLIDENTLQPPFVWDHTVSEATALMWFDHECGLPAYWKVVEEEEEKDQPAPTTPPRRSPRRHRHADIALYVPPHKRKGKEVAATQQFQGSKSPANQSSWANNAALELI